MQSIQSTALPGSLAECYHISYSALAQWEEVKGSNRAAYLILNAEQKFKQISTQTNGLSLNLERAGKGYRNRLTALVPAWNATALHRIESARNEPQLLAIRPQTSPNYWLLGLDGDIQLEKIQAISSQKISEPHLLELCFEGFAKRLPIELSGRCFQTLLPAKPILGVPEIPFTCLSWLGGEVAITATLPETIYSIQLQGEELYFRYEASTALLHIEIPAGPALEAKLRIFADGGVQDANFLITRI